MKDRDSELEQRLREAMRPVEPPAGFAERAMSALQRARAHETGAPASNRRSPLGAERRFLPRPLRTWWAAAAAASFVALVVGTGLWTQQYAQQLRAREARAQVLEALRITSRTLNAALHLTVEPSRSG